jgi:oxygen-dependent protoporphyrinogen oxidase
VPSAIVVGGGVGGLVLARDLVAGGMSVTLLEASDRLGGKVARHTVAGIDLDAGAESFANRGNTVAALAVELGTEVVAPRSGGAWLKPVVGDPIPLPHTSLLGVPGTIAADVIEVIGRRGARRARLDGLLPAFVASRERTLGGLVRRRMGSAVLEKLVAPVTTGIHSRHPDDLDVDVVAPGLRAALLSSGSLARAVRTLREAAPAGSAVSGISGGIFELVQRLALDLERHGGVIRTSARVASVDSRGVTLVGGERLEADRVVLATPLEAPTATTIALATLVLDDAALDAAPRGTGLLVAATAEGVTAKALTHSTAKWPWLVDGVPEHRHVIRLSYNGAVPADIETLARKDAESLLGVSIPPAAVLGFDVVAWPAVPAAPTPIEGVTVVGESVAGTGLAAVVSQARREAERLLGEVET